MVEPLHITCDGCGQQGSPRHIARRLERLESSTRFRPVHISTLFLSDIAPGPDGEFLYSAEGDFRGEAAAILSALGISTEGKSRETTLSEFQRRGFFFSHLLECPLENAADGTSDRLLATRFGSVITRIRASLRPKRVVLLSASLLSFAASLMEHGFANSLLLDQGAPFDLTGQTRAGVAERLRAAL